jgi:hypothetical protein
LLALRLVPAEALAEAVEAEVLPPKKEGKRCVWAREARRSALNLCFSTRKE